MTSNSRRWSASIRVLGAPQQGASHSGALSLSSKPIRAIRLRSGGLCGCSACLADEARDDAAKDRALAAIVYDLGVEQLRIAALERTPAFREAFQVAS